MNQQKPYFVGIQFDAWKFEGRSESELIAEMCALTPLTALMILNSNRIRYTPSHTAGTVFRQPQRDLDRNGRDLLDRFTGPAKEHGVDLILGVGEQAWGYNHDYPGYSQIAMIDCFGQVNRQSCVNNPTWRKFQLACFEDAVREHPYLTDIMFMHERVGPLAAVFTPAGWQAGGRFPCCFCEHCRRKGKERGYDPERAREGYKRLLALFDPDNKQPFDGWFVNFWRLIGRYPEIMAWEQLMWDNLHEFRAAVAGTARMVNPEIRVGFHFQNATLLADFIWRAGDDPERIKEYADWVKPSVYPGASGPRYSNMLQQFNRTLLRDLPLDLAHRFMAALFMRDNTIGADALDQEKKVKDGFPAKWICQEVTRLSRACAPRHLYAGLGIGVPGGEQSETPDAVRAWTEACVQSEARGVLLSRHYSEMDHALLRVAGEVLRNR